jgi:excisionase family DNA binding protein
MSDAIGLLTPDEYLTLQELAAYAKVSVRQLRNYLSLPPDQALPCYRPGRKLLVKRAEFDAWFAQYRHRGKPILARVLRDLGLEPSRLADLRPRRWPGARTGKALNQ